MPNLGATELVVTSAARTTSGSSTPTSGWGVVSQLRVQLEATAASGTTPTLDVVVEDTVDGTNYNTIATFTQLTAAGRQVVNVTTPFADTLRVRWTVAGTTPSFTFSVLVHAAA